MTPRHKFLLAMIVILGNFAIVWNIFLLPQLFPKVACVYRDEDGMPVKGWDEECRGRMDRVILRVE